MPLLRASSYKKVNEKWLREGEMWDSCSVRSKESCELSWDAWKLEVKCESEKYSSSYIYRSIIYFRVIFANEYCIPIFKIPSRLLHAGTSKTSECPALTLSQSKMKTTHSFRNSLNWIFHSTSSCIRSSTKIHFYLSVINVYFYFYFQFSYQDR